MRIRLCLAAVVGLVLIPALPASAASPQPPRHSSCAGGVPGVAAGLPGVIPGPGPDFGPFASGLATTGQVPGTVALIHDVYCADPING
jgi:hypothetical protein